MSLSLDTLGTLSKVEASNGSVQALRDVTERCGLQLVRRAASFRTSQCFIAFASRSNVKNIIASEKLRITGLIATWWHAARFPRGFGSRDDALRSNPPRRQLHVNKKPGIVGS
jgi:hypothetical protein